VLDKRTPAIHSRIAGKCQAYGNKKLDFKMESSGESENSSKRMQGQENLREKMRHGGGGALFSIANGGA